MSRPNIEIRKNASYRKIVIFTIPLIILLIVIINNFSRGEAQQFSDLANSFLHGHLNFLVPIGRFGQDPVLYHGRVYWDDGPFPAIILMPFVGIFRLFHSYFYQGYLQWLLVLGTLFFVYKLAKKLTYSIEDSLILALGFTLGSAFIGVAAVPSSWLFAQVLTTFLLFWSMYEFYYRKRWWLIGLICAFILMTRETAFPIALFFVLELWQQTNKKKFKRPKLYGQLCLPILGSIGLLGLYNFMRFHNPLNSGIGYQLLFSDSAQSRSLGTFSPIHWPANTYSAILRAPIAVLRSPSSWTLKFPYVRYNPLGMSILITSPYLINLFTNKWSSFDKRARNLLIAAGTSALLVFSFYGIGIDQFGYRYSLDFLPTLFLLFMIMYRKNHSGLSRGMKLLLLGSGLVNFYLAWSFIFP